MTTKLALLIVAAIIASPATSHFELVPIDVEMLMRPYPTGELERTPAVRIHLEAGKDYAVQKASSPLGPWQTMAEFHSFATKSFIVPDQNPATEMGFYRAFEIRF